MNIVSNEGVGQTYHYHRGMLGLTGANESSCASYQPTRHAELCGGEFSEADHPHPATYTLAAHLETSLKKVQVRGHPSQGMLLFVCTKFVAESWRIQACPKYSSSILINSIINTIR